MSCGAPVSAFVQSVIAQVLVTSMARCTALRWQSRPWRPRERRHTPGSRRFDSRRVVAFCMVFRGGCCTSRRDEVRVICCMLGMRRGMGMDFKSAVSAVRYAVLVALAGGAPGVSLAQSEGADRDRIEEIVVTARKQEEN